MYTNLLKFVSNNFVRSPLDIHEWDGVLNLCKTLHFYEKRRKQSKMRHDYCVETVLCLCLII